MSKILFLLCNEKSKIDLVDAVAIQTPVLADGHRLLKSDATLGTVCSGTFKVHDANPSHWEMLIATIIIQRLPAPTARLPKPDCVSLRGARW